MKDDDKVTLTRLAVIATLAVATAIVISVLFGARAANAQGIYMGRDGRAHPSIIVGADGGVFPVVPTFCPSGYGPCPVILAPPILPPSYAPTEPTYAVPPPSAPIGWVYGPYTACSDPTACATAVVRVGADGLNLRAAPNGPVVGALANGVPLIPLSREGDWLLVAPGCPLAPTFTWSVTSGGVPLSVCL